MEKQKEEGIGELLNPKLPTKINKEAKVQMTDLNKVKQYSIKIPISFIDELNIKKGDTFIFEVDPETKEYSIKLNRSKYGKSN